MSTTLTKNLKLKVDSNLTANAKYNLSRIDLLGGTFLVDTNNNLLIQSQENILIQPNSASIDGSGIGGTVQIGSAGQPIDTFTVYANSFNIGDSIAFPDQAVGGNKQLNIQYKSDLNGSVDTVANRLLSIDVDGANRNLILGTDFSLLGSSGLTVRITASSDITLPVTGTVSTLNNTETLTNKTLDAANNTIVGLTNGSISASAAIAYSKLSLSSSISNNDISNSAAISYSKLDLSGQISNSDVATSASIAYSKLNLNNAIVDADISTVASISGSKISPDFGNQTIRTTDKIRFSEGGYNTDIQATQAGQVVNWTLTLPDTAGMSGQLLTTDGSGNTSWVSATGTGSVTSVDMSVPSDLFAISGNPITSAGTITLTKQPQSANAVLAGPITGSPTVPSFRALDIADMPSGIVTGVTDTPSIDLTLSGNSLSGVVLPAGVDHNALMNFVANKHIDHSAVNINTAANSGLSGGGDITASRSLVIDPTNAPSVAVASGDLLLVADISAGNVLKQVTAQSIADLAAGGSTSFKTDWITADGTTKIVTHSLGSTDIIVQLFDITDGSTIEIDSVVRTDANTLTLTASSAPGAAGWRILILAI